MDFDKSALENNLDLCVRNTDWANACWLLLRLYASYNDIVVYAPQGISNLVHSRLPISKRTVFRSMQQLEEENRFTKYDEFSLQLQPALSMKGDKKVTYKGKPWNSPNALPYLDMRAEREQFWEMRGKNKTHSRDSQMKNIAKQIEESTKKIMERMELSETRIVLRLVEALRGEGLTDPTVVERVIKHTFKIIPGGLG
jgi:hypothetical protein